MKSHLKTKNYFNIRPVVCVCLSCILGICSAYFLILKNFCLAFLFLSVILIFCTSIIIYGFIAHKRLFCGLVAIVMAVFAVSGFFGLYSKTKDFKSANLNGHIYRVEGRIKEIGNAEYFNFAILDNVSIDGINGGKTTYKIKVKITGSHKFKIGDVIVFRSKLEDLGIINSYGFAAQYVNESIKYFAEIKAKDVYYKQNRVNLFEKINLFIKSTLQTGMDGQEFAMAYALMTGNSDYMENELLNNFRYAGVAHIFAVSGLHVSILAASVSFLLTKLKINKFLANMLAFCCCFIYSGVCGFSASSLRAVIMFGLHCAADLSGKKYDTLSSLALAALIILTFKPLQFFMLGFRFSFLVVIGMVLLSKPISALLPFLSNKFASAIATALSA